MAVLVPSGGGNKATNSKLEGPILHTLGSWVLWATACILYVSVNYPSVCFHVEPSKICKAPLRCTHPQAIFKLGPNNYAACVCISENICSCVIMDTGLHLVGMWKNSAGMGCILLAWHLASYWHGYLVFK